MIMKKYIRAVDRGDALVGIYWYLEDSNKVIGLSESVDNGELDGEYIHYSGPNHFRAWRNVIKDNLPDSEQEEMINKGFKSLYRGRCIYSTMTQTYVITCSSELINNLEFRSKVKEYFQLDSVRVSFTALDHYAHKIELTGNPAIDAFYFD